MKKSYSVKETVVLNFSFWVFINILSFSGVAFVVVLGNWIS